MQPYGTGKLHKRLQQACKARVPAPGLGRAGSRKYSCLCQRCDSSLVIDECRGSPASAAVRAAGSRAAQVRHPSRIAKRQDPDLTAGRVCGIAAAAAKGMGAAARHSEQTLAPSHWDGAVPGSCSVSDSEKLPEMGSHFFSSFCTVFFF